ncbi:hypothetical protein MMC18_000446 [Xylographa bjoerkii]|nr:hypothetical protein [Xylographa bjoerkii]
MQSLSKEGSRLLTKAEVPGNMFFYVIAGFDTTFTTLSFVFLLLALHHSCQVLLQQQLDEVLGSKAVSEWGADTDLQQLLGGYLGAIVSETLRLYHSVAWYTRMVVRDTTLTDSKDVGHMTPADTIIIIDVTAISRHPTYWPSENASTEWKERSPALDFDPLRWLKFKGQEDPENKAAFPFSSGYRMCPGERFAEVEMCAIVARFLSQFSLRLKPRNMDVMEAKSVGHD